VVWSRKQYLLADRRLTLLLSKPLPDNTDDVNKEAVPSALSWVEAGVVLQPNNTGGVSKEEVHASTSQVEAREAPPPEWDKTGLMI
jgi:hypothetical protein